MKKKHYKIRLRKTVLVPKTTTSLRTTLTSEAHLAEEQFLVEEQTLHLINRPRARRSAVFKRKR
jgi:hypothetical protein